MKRFETDFLALAATWLACRFRVFHGDNLIGCKIQFDLTFDFLGCSDSAGELRLLCEEVRNGFFKNRAF